MSSKQPGLRALLPVAGLLLGATLSAGCASPPSQILSASHLTVTYWDFRTDTYIILASETDPLYEDLYSQPLDTAAIKLAPDEDLKELVQFTGSSKFFAEAGNLARPTTSMKARGYGMIVVQADHTHYSVLLDKESIAANPDLMDEFSEFRTRIRALYDSIHQLQFIQTKTGSGGNYFEQEQERLRRENQERMGKKDGDA